MRLLRVAADMLELEPDPSVDPRPVTERGNPGHLHITVVRGDTNRWYSNSYFWKLSEVKVNNGRVS